MIVWCIVLTVLLLANLGLTFYVYKQSELNKKAITEVMAPLWEKHEQLLLKLLGKK